MENEEWRQIAGYEGVYSVSSLGRVRRDRPYSTTRVGLMIAGNIDGRGYRQVLLHNRGRRTFKVHALVLGAFVGSRPAGHHANHKNGNKTDNRLSNLEWVTPRENSLHAVRVLGKGRGDTHGMHKLTAAQVAEIRARIVAGERQVLLATEYGVTQGLIAAIKRRAVWSHL